MADGKKNKKTFVIIIIILGILCLLGGFFLNNSNIFKKETKKVVDKNKQKITENNSKKLSNLYRTITNSSSIGCGYYKLFTNKKMTSSDLNDKEKAKMVAYKLYLKSGDGTWFGTTFTKEEFEEAAKELFGSSINNEDIEGCPSIKYDSSKGEYKVENGECEKLCDTEAKSIITKSIEEKDSLEIYIKVVFIKNGKYYADYAKTKKISVDTDKNDIISKDSINKGSLYKAVFNKVEGNYIFDYVEPVKD